jgi:tetratricopeptide (TPR) repeat protein
MGQRSLLIAFIISLSLMVYSNTLGNDFQLDDYARVKDNPGIHKLMPVWRHFLDPGTMSTYPEIAQFRPLLPLTLSLNYSIAGDSLPGYHLGNLLFQILAAVLVFFAALELQRQSPDDGREEGRRRWIAFAAACLFAVHPVSGILVNYICSRDLILMELFLLLAFLIYMRMRRLGDSPVGWALALAALALSLLSKTNAVVAPLLVLLFELVVRKEPWNRRGPWLRALPFAAVVLAFFAYTSLFLKFSDLAAVLSPLQGAWMHYFPTQAKLHFFAYVFNFLYPFRVHLMARAEPVGFLDPGAVLGAAFVLFTFFIAWKFRRSEPLVSFCILAYWILQIPESSVIPLIAYRVDYRPYPSSPFLFLLAGLLVYKHLRPRLRPVLLMGALIYFGASSFFMNRPWRTMESLCRHSIKLGATAHAYQALSTITDDPRERKKLLEEALRVYPEYALAHSSLGLTLIQLGQRDTGLAECRKAVRLYPENARLHYFLGRAYASAGMMKESIQESESAADLDPRTPLYGYQAAMDSVAQGRFEDALRRSERMLAVDPTYPNALFVRAFALQNLGRQEEAVAGYRSYLQYRPDDFQGWFNLGYALMGREEYREAARCFERALELKPDLRDAHLHLGNCYEKLGDSAAAARHRMFLEQQ